MDARLDLWRNSVAYLAKNALEESKALIPDDGQNITSLATSPISPHLAVGSGSKSTNFFLVKTPKKPSGEFSISAGFTGPGPVYSLAWSGRTILSGSSNGTVQIYDVDADKLDIPEEAANAVKCTAQLAHPLPKNLPLSPPGYFYNSNRVVRVDFSPTVNTSSPTAATEFATSIGTNVCLWDINQANEPLRTEKVGHNANFALKYHWDPAARIIGVGGADKAICILDPRKSGKCMVWRYRMAHEGYVRDVAWHPYIPYWLTTAGDDYGVLVFDIRYDSRPVLSLTQHHGGPVTSISWSNSHCDFLATASADRQFRLWQLRPTKSESTGQREVTGEALVESTPLMNSAVVACACSRRELDVYYAVSSLGELRSYGLKNELLGMVAMHRYNEQQHPLEHAIESAVYRRDLDMASRLVKRWMKQPGADQRQQEAQTFTDLITPRPAFDASTWTVAHAGSRRAVAGAADPVETFPREMAKRAWFLPPGFDPNVYGRSMSSAPDGTVRVESPIKLLLKDALDKNDHQAVLKLQDDIMQSFSSDPGVIDGRAIRDMLKCILPHDPVGALKFGLRIIELQRDTSFMLAADLAPSVHMLLYPTVYDHLEDAPPNEDRSLSPAEERELRKKERRAVIAHMEQALRQPEGVCEMIGLEIEIQKIVSKEDDSIPRELIRVIRGRETVSSGALQLYFNSLIQLRMYEEYFVEVSRHIATHGSSDFGRTLKHRFLNTAVPKCRQYLSAFVQAAQTDPDQMVPQDYRDITDMCLRILRQVTNDIPGLERELLHTYIRELNQGYCTLLEMYQKQRRHQEVPKEAQLMIRTLLDRGSQAGAGATDMRHVNANELPEVVVQAAERLQRFLRL